MFPARLLPACLLLLAGCAEPPATASRNISVPADCQDACASGYRWAVKNEVDTQVKCRGESDFANGCRRAVESVQRL